jgi:hypothetical protein
VSAANAGRDSRAELQRHRTVRRGWQLIVAGARELAPGVDVILGDDFFHNVDVEFDLAHDAVRLFQAKDCDGVSLAYWTTEVTGEVTIEAVHDAQPQIILPVKVNERPIQAPSIPVRHFRF